MTHDFLIAKLDALDFDINALNLIFDYLTGEKQRVKNNSSFSLCLEIFISRRLAKINFRTAIIQSICL